MSTRILATFGTMLALVVGFTANLAHVEDALGFRLISRFAQQRIDVAVLRVTPRQYRDRYWSADLSIAITNTARTPVIVTGLSYHVRESLEDVPAVANERRSGNVMLVPVEHHAIQTSSPGKRHDMASPVRIDVDDMHTLTISIHERYQVPYKRHTLFVRLHTTKGMVDTPEFTVGLGVT